MDNINWGTVVVAIFSGGLISSGIAFIANKRNIAADTYQKLATIVSSLTGDLEDERVARRKDKAYFQEELERMQVEYKHKLASLEKRVAELEMERANLLLENHRLKKQLGA